MGNGFSSDFNLNPLDFGLNVSHFFRIKFAIMPKFVFNKFQEHAHVRQHNQHCGRCIFLAKEVGGPAMEKRHRYILHHTNVHFIQI